MNIHGYAIACIFLGTMTITMTHAHATLPENAKKASFIDSMTLSSSNWLLPSFSHKSYRSRRVSANHSHHAAIDFLRRNILHIEWSFWKGFWFSRGGSKIGQGFLGSNYKVLFQGSKKALEIGKLSHSFQIAGLTAILLFIPITFGNLLLFAIPQGAATGSILVGLITVNLFSVLALMVGAILLSIGRGLTFTAAKRYNEDLLGYAREKKWGGSSKAFLSHQATISTPTQVVLARF